MSGNCEEWRFREISGKEAVIDRKNTAISKWSVLHYRPRANYLTRFVARAQEMRGVKFQESQWKGSRVTEEKLCSSVLTDRNQTYTCLWRTRASNCALHFTRIPLKEQTYKGNKIYFPSKVDFIFKQKQHISYWRYGLRGVCCMWCFRKTQVTEAEIYREINPILQLNCPSVLTHRTSDYMFCAVCTSSATCEILGKSLQREMRYGGKST
jgi:hypothetical protein